MPNVIESSKTGGFRRYILIGPPLAQHVGMGQYCAIINKCLSNMLMLSGIYTFSTLSKNINVNVGPMLITVDKPTNLIS